MSHADRSTRDNNNSSNRKVSGTPCAENETTSSNRSARISNAADDDSFGSSSSGDLLNSAEYDYSDDEAVNILQFVIEEGGARLSQGQKQLL